MPTLTGFDATVRLDFQGGLARLLSGIIVEVSPTKIVIANGQYRDEFFGTFTYNDTTITGGTLTGITEYVNGVKAYTISDLSIPALTFVGWIPNAGQALQQVLIGADTMTGSTASDALFGFSGSDSIDGASGNDSIDGGDGADTIHGGAGADCLVGNTGNDEVHGGLGDDRLSDGGLTTADRYFGEEGNDAIDSGGGVDYVDGGVGNDTITGGSAGSTVLGGDGADMITVGYGATDGGAGNDIFELGGGASVITGGAGADTYRYWRGSVTIVDFDPAGGDAFDFTFFSTAATINRVYQSGADVVVEQTGGAIAATLKNISLGSLTTLSLGGISLTGAAVRWGGASGENLTGGSVAEEVYGNGGNDTLDGGGGADTLYGGAGADRFVFSLGGTVDVLADFTPGESDNILLTGATGANGMLIHERTTGALSWDADGDGLGGTRFATWSSTAGLSQSSFAGGFQPAYVYVKLNEAGAKTITTLHWGNATYDHTSTTFDHLGREEVYESWFKDGSSSIRYVDVAQVADFSVRAADYDAQGGMTAYAITRDDGGRTLYQFDLGNTRFWSRLVEEYDAQGRLSQQSFVRDDGTAREMFIDTYDTEKWATHIKEYAATGALLSDTYLNADGSVFVG